MKLWILLCLSTTVLGCGFRHTEDAPSRARRMIVGGDNVTTPLKWPWQVYMRLLTPDGAFGCGGTIVSEQWLLTAAHCVDGIDASKIEVVSGITHRVAEWNNGTHSKIAFSKIFPGYVTNGHSAKNDIALLKLESRLTFNEAISSICLPSPAQQIPTDGRAVATGFGAYNVTNKNISMPISDGQLRETIVPIVSNEVCSDDWRFTDAPLPPNVVCASSRTHGTHAGDSGGPLVMKTDNKQWFQIGIASYIGGYDGGIDGEQYPKVWTDIRSFCPWIKEQTNGEVHCSDEEVVLENATKEDVKSGSEDDETDVTEKPEATDEPQVEPESTPVPGTKEPEVTKEPESEPKSTDEPEPETTPEQGSEATDEPESNSEDTDEPDSDTESTDEPESETTTEADSDFTDEPEDTEEPTIETTSTVIIEV